MKKIIIHILMCFITGVTWGQTTMYNLREMFKDPSSVSLLSFEMIEVDSLNKLLGEGYDISKLNVNWFAFGQNQDSVTIVRILELLKPISKKVKKLSYDSPYRIDISSFTSLEALHIHNVGGFNNYSVLKIKTLERIFINGKSEGIKLNITESDPIFSLETIGGLTIHLDSNDIMPYELIHLYRGLYSIEIKDPKLDHIPDNFSDLKYLGSCSFYEHSINDKSINTLFELPSIRNLYLVSKGEFPKVYWWLVKKNKINKKIKTSTVTQVYVSGNSLKGKDLRFARRLKRKLRNEEGVKIQYNKYSKKDRNN